MKCPPPSLAPVHRGSILPLDTPGPQRRGTLALHIPAGRGAEWEAELGTLLSLWQRVSHFHGGAGKTVSLCSSNPFCSRCLLLVFTVQPGW